jgi:polyphosphate kinase
MERNLSNRIEVCFPILKKKHSARILEELELSLQDVHQSWELDSEGQYHPLAQAGEAESAELGVQQLLLERLA